MQNFLPYTNTFIITVPTLNININNKQKKKTGKGNLQAIKISE